MVSQLKDVTLLIGFPEFLRSNIYGKISFFFLFSIFNCLAIFSNKLIKIAEVEMCKNLIMQKVSST